jgi:hypothetical protein
VAHLDGAEVEGGTYDELGAFENAHAGCLGVEDGAGADEDVGALLGEFPHDFNGARDGHGDLEDGDSAVGYGACDGEGFVYGVGAEDGDEADSLEGLEDFVFLHFYGSWDVVASSDKNAGILHFVQHDDF